jgi:hypothetical protein
MAQDFEHDRQRRCGARPAWTETMIQAAVEAGILQSRPALAA